MSSVKLLATTFAAVLVGFATPAWAGSDAGMAVETAAATLTPNQFVWNDTATAEPVRVVVNIAEQRAYVYRGDALVAATTVSTGKDGKDTPSGTFTILQKAIDHHSNKYNNAAMPFMQRLTWDGVAIHAGKNPGFPASHGCVRVPLAFAKKLYGITTVGTEVTVIGADGTVAPTAPQAPAAPAFDTSSETAAANTAATQVAAR
jgi:lipoprotein-anchoring transpeptidase ErfK/SrfK